MTSSDGSTLKDALEIRTPRRDDAAAIRRVRSDAIWAKATTHYDDAIVRDWVEAGDPGRIANKLSDPDIIALVAASGDALIGFGMVALSKHELQALYVTPNPIGRVGQALLAALETRAFQVLPFLILDASLNAEEFYRSNGYLVECRKDHVSSRGGVVSQVVQMRKSRPHVGSD
jgi:hypothetical protein